MFMPVLKKDVKEHQKRVSIYSYWLAKAYGCSEKVSINALLCGRIHDVGKAMIPDNILNKPGNLTSEEFELVKKHSWLGSNYLHTRGVNQEICNCILHHHESFDGSGYPDSISDCHIPLLSRIIKITDVYDALTTIRCYRYAVYTYAEALDIMEGMINQFDPEIFLAFQKDPFIAGSYSQNTIEA